MSKYSGKYQPSKAQETKGMPYFLVVLSFFLVEVFAFFFLSFHDPFEREQLWVLAFG